MRGKTLYACRAARGIACVSAACVAFASPISAASAAGGARPPTGAPSSVVSTRIWTDTGVALQPGDLVAVRATGRVHFGRQNIDRVAPTGIPWGQSCAEISNGGKGWPAPGLACWSLIGRIGTEPPFEIGAAKAFRVPRAGELFLGVNDNDLTDNAGTWPVTVSVTPAPAAAASKKSSTPIVLVGLIFVAVLALVVLFALLARRRGAAARRAAAPPAAPEIPALVPAAVGGAGTSEDILPEPRVHAEPAPVVPVVPVVRAVESDSTDVNIFEVEFVDLASLRVGYNYFPEGTVLRWRVRQDATMGATGQFVTEGGGSAVHFVTIQLGKQLSANPDGADVDFTWTVGGVPFGYSVRRNPGG